LVIRHIQQIRLYIRCHATYTAHNCQCNRIRSLSGVRIRRTRLRTTAPIPKAPLIAQRSRPLARIGKLHRIGSRAQHLPAAGEGRRQRRQYRHQASLRFSAAAPVRIRHRQADAINSRSLVWMADPRVIRISLRRPIPEIPEIRGNRDAHPFVVFVMKLTVGG